ncbi:hypothetical protein Daus18300_000914 [Diaporthe australafricana]|uniref:Uncharacterized protein n=1 Tax=Diaporthe australafricana TaxID=127596 RepID=A0ABR3Y1V3_9PEZI
MAAQQDFQVTSGGKGLAFFPEIVFGPKHAKQRPPQNEALAPAFHGDPVYAWLLHTFDSSEHDSVRLKLFRAFFTQCALNNGMFIEVGGFGACGLLMPPGATAENPWTLLQAGLLPALWNIGVGTFKVLLSSFLESTR